MSDNPNPQQQQTPDPSAGSPNTDPTGQGQPAAIPYSRFQEVNDARKRAEEELEKFRQAEKARQEAEALAQGQFQKVIDELRPRAERAETLEKTLLRYYEAELADVPEGLKKLVPEGDVTTKLAWIREAKAAGLFNPQSAPQTDAGARGDGRQALPKLTELERQMAKMANMTEKEYAEWKARGQQPPTDDKLNNLLGG